MTVYEVDVKVRVRVNAPDGSSIEHVGAMARMITLGETYPGSCVLNIVEQGKPFMPYRKPSGRPRG